MTKDTIEESRERAARYRIRMADHVARYQATDGAEGFDDNHHKAPTLLLTTTGRRSGKAFVTPLYYGESDGDYILIASYAGSDSHPQWYKNLIASPDVTVQIRDRVMSAVARETHGDERRRYWRILADAYPFYDDYREATEREIPVIAIRPRP